MTDARSNPSSPNVVPALRMPTLHQIDRLFDEFDGPFLTRSLLGNLTPRAFAAPAVDIAENDKTYELTAELPGMSENDVQVEVQNGELRIKGEKKEFREEKEKDRYLSERRYGAFERRFALPRLIDAEKIQAAFQNGVLTVTIPKTADAGKATKKIAVKSS